MSIPGDPDSLHVGLCHRIGKNGQGKQTQTRAPMFTIKAKQASFRVCLVHPWSKRRLLLLLLLYLFFFLFLHQTEVDVGLLLFLLLLRLMCLLLLVLLLFLVAGDMCAVFCVFLHCGDSPSR